MNNRSADSSPREKILAAAFRIFRRRGYKLATVREVSQQAGVSVGSLYLHFKNKEALYLELGAKETGNFDRMAASLPNLDPVAALRTYIRWHMHFAVRNKGLIIQHLKDVDLRFMQNLRKTFFERQKTLVEDILRSGREKGLFDVPDVEEMALLILFAIRGAVVSYFSNRTEHLNRLEDSLCRIARGAAAGDQG